VCLLLWSRREADWSVVGVAGELDIATDGQLRDCLNRTITGHGRPVRMIIDLSELSFCDASGLGVLVGAYHQTKRFGGRMRLVCPEGRVLRLLRIAELTDLLPVYGSIPAALTDPTGTGLPPSAAAR